MHTTAGGPSSGRIWIHRRIIASRRVWCRSSSNRVVAVKEVAHSRSTSMSCLDRLITSAANETRTASGGREVFCSSRAFRVSRKTLSHATNGLVDIEGIQITFCDSLELITGWVTELDV